MGLLPERLRELRERLHCTQQQVSDDLNIENCSATTNVAQESRALICSKRLQHIILYLSITL